MSATMESELGGEARVSGAPGRTGATARLSRYAVWQFRDFMRERGIWIAALGLIALWMFRLTYDYAAIAEAAEYARRQGRAWTPPTEAQHFRSSLAGVVGLGAFIGTLIASHGIVSRDRERGYQRFLFAKPVSVVRYYLQAFLVNGAGLVMTLAALLAVTGVVFMRVTPDVPSFLAYAAANYVMLGGLVMLLSTFARYDFALATLLVGAASPLHALASGRAPNPFAWIEPFLFVLPPVDSLGEAARALGGGRSIAGYLMAPLCYGAIYVAAALFVLRRRSIAP